METDNSKLHHLAGDDANLRFCSDFYLTFQNSILPELYYGFSDQNSSRKSLVTGRKIVIQ